MEWFSITKTKDAEGETRGERVWHFVAYRRSKGLRWVKRRDGLPIEITEINGGSRKDGKRGHAVFNYKGVWNDTDLIRGKGDMLCSSPQIRVWSMAIVADNE